MTITPFQMYLLTMLDSVSSWGVFFVLMALFCGVIGIIIAFGFPDSFGWDSKKMGILNVGIVFTCLSFLWSLIPSTKQMAAIIIIPKIVNNQKVQEIPDKLLSLAEAWMEELKPSQEEKK